MAHKKSYTVLDPSPSDCDRDGHDQLTSTVDTLAQEVRVLREAIDELRELLEWAVQNREAQASDHPFRPGSGSPGDAVDKDDEEDSERINLTKPGRVSHEGKEVPGNAAPGELF